MLAQRVCGICGSVLNLRVHPDRFSSFQHIADQNCPRSLRQAVFRDFAALLLVQFAMSHLDNRQRWGLAVGGILLTLLLAAVFTFGSLNIPFEPKNWRAVV